MLSQIKSTKNYSKFKLFGSNRDLKPRNVSRLMESIKKIGLSPFKPIIVDKHYKVIDGQNRLEACKRLNIPVYYVRSNHTEFDIPVLNANQEKWRTEDYVKYYAKQDVKSYQLLLEISGKCHATISGIMAALDCRDNEAIKDGSFSLSGDSTTLAKIVEDRLNFCFEIRGKRSISRKICIAINYLSRVKTFNYELLKKRMKERPHLVHTCDNVNDYIKMFTQIYNFRKRKDRISKEDLYKINIDRF